MKIAVAGWYFHKPLMKILEASKYPCFVVSHKPLMDAGIEGVCIRNIGLEFGCYDWYLKNKWTGDTVLMFHDDNDITEAALDEISKIQADQVYLFSSEEEAKANGQCHGRAMFCSEKFLTQIKADGGFWFDEGNTGQIAPTSAMEPNYHNQGIIMFRAYLQSLPKEFIVSQVAVVPGLKTGYRGKI